MRDLAQARSTSIVDLIVRWCRQLLAVLELVSVAQAPEWMDTHGA
jgi:hypothetical protein